MRTLIATTVFLAAGGCQFMVGVTPCRENKAACGAGEVCDDHLGVCVDAAPAPVDPPPPNDAGVVIPAPQGGEGEGEGEGEHAGEGEGSLHGGEGEGEREGALPVGGEGEGEGEGAVALQASRCGNGVIESGETCDDGNLTSGDGCSSRCQTELTLTESEPNDFPDESGIQHHAVAAVSVAGELVHSHNDAEAGGAVPDTDGAFWTQPTGTVGRVQLFTQGADDCDSTAQLEIALVQDVSPDFPFLRVASQNAIRGCPAMTFTFDASTFGLVYHDVNASDVHYRLELTAFHDRGGETEPNDDIDNAEVAADDGLDASMSGAVDTANDADFYAVVVPPGAGLRAEVVPNSSATTCDVFNAQVALVDETGTNLLSRGGTDIACPFIDGTGSAPTDGVARNSGSTTAVYYVVVARGGAAFTGRLPYHIAITVR